IRDPLVTGVQTCALPILTELPQRDDVRVLVITGTGRGFCSGGDVDEIIGALLEQETHQTMEFTRMTGAVIKAMRECPIPIVASRSEERRVGKASSERGRP